MPWELKEKKRPPNPVRAWPSPACHALDIQRVQKEAAKWPSEQQTTWRSVSQGWRQLALGDACRNRGCGHPEILGTALANTQATCRAFLLQVTGMIRGISALSAPSLRLGIRVGSTKQPPLPPALPALIGRREAALWLFCASASSGEPGSEVAWLWTALLPWKLHPPSLLSPSSQSHPQEQRNRGDRGGRENWPGDSRPFLPCPAFPPHSIPHRVPAAQACPQAPGGAASYRTQPIPTPATWGWGDPGPPCWREAWS